MFRWNMTLETGIESVDHGRRVLLEAMADFFLALDDPRLNQHLVAERTGAIFNAMKEAFAVEDKALASHSDAEAAHHIATHAALKLSYVDLCKKLVPRIKTLKQAQQVCLEIYRNIDSGLYHHINDEALAYKHRLKHPPATKA